jgi:hypothetical protein
VRPRSRRRLTQPELRAAGVSPGLMFHRVGPDGRARLEQLALEGDDEVSTKRPRALVEARHDDVVREREILNAQEAAWHASARAYTLAREAERREAWRAHYLLPAECHARLAAENRLRAAGRRGW